MSEDKPVEQQGGGLYSSEELRQAMSGRGIEANTIEGTNVVSGLQFIGRQIIQQSDPQYFPPLYRPLRIRHFINREQERTWLLNHLQPGRVVTLWGPGGIGKTALVTEVLWQLAPGNNVPDNFPDGIFFYDFREQAEVTIALEQLARSFGEEPLPNPKLAARRALNRRCALLVFDGAEEADHLKELLKECASCAVLVTSQRQSDAIDLEYCKYLPPLEREEAVAVVQAWGREQAADESTIRDICERIGCLPLALCLVGRYLALHEEEASEYLHWFQDTPWVALHQGESEQESVKLLLDRSVTKLSEDAKLVLITIGLLAPVAFDHSMLTQILQCSDRTTRQALNELQEYSLVIPLERRYKVSHALIYTYAHDRLPATDNGHTNQRKQLSENLIQVGSSPLTGECLSRSGRARTSARMYLGGRPRGRFGCVRRA